MSFCQKPWLLSAARVVGFLLLALHGAEAAHRERPQGVQRLALLLFPQCRPHADGELIDPHAAGLGRQKVTQLVYGDQYAEHQHAPL